MENKTEKFNYYREQLNRIRTHGEYPAKVQLTDVDNRTNHLDLNDESANELVKWLKENYNITQ